jgi:predicted enzyme related to lactoylglutathione lyase
MALAEARYRDPARPLPAAGVSEVAYDFQVAVDAARPHVLADWWADALGWTVEPTDEAFIQRMITEGYATEADTTTHNGGLVWAEGAAIQHPGGPESGNSGRIYFQLVPESKTAKNRVHLDVRVGAAQIEAEQERLIATGATFLYRASQGPHNWVTMADPEGNEFCIT